MTQIAVALLLITALRVVADIEQLRAAQLMLGCQNQVHALRRVSPHIWAALPLALLSSVERGPDRAIRMLAPEGSLLSQRAVTCCQGSINRDEGFFISLLQILHLHYSRPGGAATTCPLRRLFYALAQVQSLWQFHLRIGK